MKMNLTRQHADGGKMQVGLLRLAIAVVFALLTLAAFAQDWQQEDRRGRRQDDPQNWQQDSRPDSGQDAWSERQRGGQRQDGGWRRNDRRRRNDRQAEIPESVRKQGALSLILGRPTASQVTLSVLSANLLNGYVEYGQAAKARRSRQLTFEANKPAEILLDGLKPDAACFYRVYTRSAGQTAFVPGETHRFQTQRSPGRAFSFAIQGDSHPERLGKQFDPVLYAQTLNAVAADGPDFYLTIGDDFSVDNLEFVTAETVTEIYRKQRLFLGLVGACAPIFLVNGNHEQAARYLLDGTPGNVAVLAQNARNRLFPQPAPDSFYSGDAETVSSIGLLRDYYSWTWGDALFVVIDPYWHSQQPVDNRFGGGAKTRDLWNSTLGDKQYFWLKQTLEQSKARYKFVFTHHVLGTGRGGVESAGLYEWGGYEKSGACSFKTRRPGWPLPVHQLFVKTGVTIFFQGHDHVFVRQEMNGVTYLTLPQPADPNYTLNNENAYYYGDKLPNSGYLRVTVAPRQVLVEYVREYLPGTGAQKTSEIAYRFTVPARAR
jgi:hypothetical protein